MMNEIEKASESAHNLARSIYLYSDYIKAAEVKLSPDFFTRSTMTVQLNELKFYDDMMFPAFTTTTDTKFL